MSGSRQPSSDICSPTPVRPIGLLDPVQPKAAPSLEVSILTDASHDVGRLHQSDQRRHGSPIDPASAVRSFDGDHSSGDQCPVTSGCIRVAEAGIRSRFLRLGR